MTYYPKCIDCASEAQLDEQQLCEECNTNRKVYQNSWYQEQEDRRYSYD